MRFLYSASCFVLAISTFTCLGTTKDTKKRSNISYSGAKLKTAVLGAQGTIEGMGMPEILIEVQSYLTESPAFELYDRQRLELVLKEHSLTLNGLVEKNDLASIGNFSGIEAGILIQMQKLDSRVYGTMQLLHIKTAEVLTSITFTSPDHKLSLGRNLRESTDALTRGFILRKEKADQNTSRKIAVVLLEELSESKRDLNGFIPVLETHLVSDPAVTVISRNQLEFLMKAQLKEQKMTFEGLVKSAGLAEFGKVAGVQFIVLGTLGELNDTMNRAGQITLQAIETGTARTIASESIKRKETSDGLRRAGASLIERLTKPQDSWRSHNN